MRLIPISLLGLLALALVPAAEAASTRGETRATASKSAKAAPARAAAARPAAQTRAARPAAALRSATAKPSQIMRPGGAQRVASRAPVARAVPRNWQSGLPVASGEQRECPVGTMSTLARGHDNVVRCLPL